MREIKFRAWDVNRNKMVIVGNIHFDQVGGYSFCVDVNGTLMNHCVLMQYTGLKDKNGVEIYEDDICLADGECGAEYPLSDGVAVKNTIIANVDPHPGLPLGDYVGLEVIGNIYKNTDLNSEL